MQSVSTKQASIFDLSTRLEHFSLLIFNYVQTMRPTQWSKNFLVLAGVLYFRNFFQTTFLVHSLLGFFTFCMISSSVYIINDLADLEKDRNHPLKRQRPIASGSINKKTTLILGCVLAIAAFLVAYVMELRFFTLVVLYFVTMIGYSLYLKNFLILYILLVASGYLIRAAAGAFIVDVTISPWLILCTLFLALFLVTCKRRHEFYVLGTNSHVYRQTLAGYTPQLLDQLISITTAGTVLCYTLYTLSPHTVSLFGSVNLIYTVPIVIFGVFRYLFLVYKNNAGSNPEILIWNDKPLFISIVVWVILSMKIIYDFGAK